MARQNLRFDRDDLPAAALDSCRLLGTLFRNGFKGPSIFERGLFAGQLLPALNHNVHILRVELDPVADSLRQF